MRIAILCRQYIRSDHSFYCDFSLMEILIEIVLQGECGYLYLVIEYVHAGECSSFFFSLFFVLLKVMNNFKFSVKNKNK